MYLVAIIIASSIPGRSLPKIVILSPDKLLHMAEYGIFGFLAFKSFTKLRIPIIIFGALLFAIFDELWQSMIPGRMSSIFDVIADILGFLIVIGTMVYFSRKKSEIQPDG